MSVIRYRTANCITVPVLMMCFAMLLPTAIAQTGTTTINGVVTDQSGAPIPSAIVTATDTQTGLAAHQNAGAHGDYTIPNLSPGLYDVQASAPGFSTLIRKNQQLLVGTTITLNFPLGVASVSQTVEVTTAAPVIQVTQSQLDTVIQTQQLNNLPIINRTFASLAQLSPGVQVNGTTIQFGDSGSWANNYIVDGSSIQQQNGGGQLLNLAQDWIQEFSVVSQLAPAEYNLASSGFINAITRSGGNQIHGRAYGYFQNAALNATPEFLPAKEPNKPAYNQERLGGFLGGPIQKDKLFYFMGYEYLHLLTSVPITVPPQFTNPEATSGVFPQTTTTQLAMAKIDYKINNQHSLRLRANIEADAYANNGIGLSGSTFHPLGYGTSENKFAPDYLVTWQYIPTPNAVNIANANWYGQNNRSICNDTLYLGPYPGYPAQPGSTPYGNPTGWYAEVIYGGPSIETGCSNDYGGQAEQDWVVSDTLTATKGSNELKFGFDVGRHNQADRGTHRLADGTYTMLSTLQVPFNPATPCGATCGGFPLSYSIAGEIGNTLVYNAYSPYYGLFAQDSFRVNNRLTLNVGLRYDVDLGNGGIKTNPLLNPIYNDMGALAPRAGFAYTPTQSKHTVVRGGFGIFYDEVHDTVGNYYSNTTYPTILLNINATSPTLNPYCYGNSLCNNGVPLVYENAVQEVLAYSLANYTVPIFPINGVPTTLTIGGNNYSIPALPASAIVSPSDQWGSLPAAIFTIDPNYKVPGTLEATVGGEQQIRDGLGVAADFVYTYGFHQELIYNSNINPSTYQPIKQEFSSITTLQSGGYFNDYSVRAQAHYRDHRGDTAQVAYTLAFAYDNDPAANWNYVSTSQNVTNPLSQCDYCEDYGRAGVAHNNLNISGVGILPFGVVVSPIVYFLSGIPYTATTTLRSGPLVGNCPVYYTQCYPAGYSKGSLTGANTFTLASRVAKTLTFHDRYTASFFFEGYNLTNHPNYGTTFGTNIQATNFRKPTGAGSMRQLQAGFQFDF